MRSAKFEADKLVSVGVQCSDVGSPFGYESDTLTVHELIDVIKAGGRVVGLWPAGQVWRHCPLEVIFCMTKPKALRLWTSIDRTALYSQRWR